MDVEEYKMWVQQNNLLVEIVKRLDVLIEFSANKNKKPVFQPKEEYSHEDAGELEAEQDE